MIFDIQHYAIHDGPGIRTAVFFKGCPLDCAWCCNPESKAFEPQKRNIRGHDEPVVCGKEYSVKQLFDIISKDTPFYRNSGGGVTFTGGEPLAQPEFLLNILKVCKEAGIHTAVETCGWCSKETMSSVAPLIDLFLYDLKLIDDELHERYTGRSNLPILNNLHELATARHNVIVRLPLIPGITDTRKNIEAIGKIMKDNGLREVSLEPYHQLGVQKYAELGLEYRLPEMVPHTQAQLLELRDYFTGQGLTCEIA